MEKKILTTVWDGLKKHKGKLGIGAVALAVPGGLIIAGIAGMKWLKSRG